MKKHLKPGLFLGFMVMVTLIAFFSYRLSHFDGDSQHPDLPSWIGQSPNNIEAASIDFNVRVKKQFPPGTNIEALKTELSAGGFVAQPGHNDQSYAVRTDRRMPCLIDRTILWKADEHQKVREIRGTYSVTCP